MNKEPNMNMHLFLTGTRRVLSILPLTGVLLVGSTSALAQVVATLPPPQSVVTIPIAGTVNSSTATNVATRAPAALATGTAESVSFANANIQIDSTIARDPNPAIPPQVIVNITFLKAAGVGVTSATKYTADYRVTKIRPLVGTDVIAVTFPFSQDKPQGYLEARAGLATFTLTFDANGVITGASGAIGTNALLN
jgi:hypothetical protein